MDIHSRNTAPSQGPPPLNSTHIPYPINLSGNTTFETHPHIIPTRRREAENFVIDAQNPPPTITTTYKVITEPPRHTSINETGRTRRSSVDGYGCSAPQFNITPLQDRPTFQPASARTPASRYGPGGSGDMSTPASSWQESNQQQQHHWKHVNMQSQPVNIGSRVKSSQMMGSGEYPESIEHNFEGKGFRFTKPRDTSQHDLHHAYDVPRHYPGRIESEKKPRPRSMITYADLGVPKFYDSRDANQNRGFDRLRTDTLNKYSHPVRPAKSSPPLGVYTGMRYRPQSVDPFIQRRISRHGRRLRSRSRDQTKYDKNENFAEQQSFGIRSDGRERFERSEMKEQRKRAEPRSKDTKEFKRVDALVTGLGIAGAAIGLKALKNASHDERRLQQEREGKRRKESRKEYRNQSDRADVESTDSRSSRDSRKQNLRKNAPSVRPSRTAHDDVLSYESEEPQSMRVRRDQGSSLLQRIRKPSKPTKLEFSSSESEDSLRRRGHMRKGKSPIVTRFDPNDTMNLRTLKRELVKSTESESTSESTVSDSDEDWTEVDFEPHHFMSSQSRPPRVVSPPREQTHEKPVKGILRPPRDKFPEDPVPTREGIAPSTDVKKRLIPPDARWTRVRRSVVNPEALEAGKEQFEALDDSIIIFRVLTADEIQHYADLTQEIRISHEQEYMEYENYAASRSNSNSGEEIFQQILSDQRGPENHSEDLNGYGRTNFYPESQNGYGDASFYRESQNGYGGASFYPESHHFYGSANYHPESQYGDGNDQNYHNGLLCDYSSNPVSSHYAKQHPYDDRFHGSYAGWYERRQNGPFLSEGGAKYSNILPSEYPSYGSLMNHTQASNSRIDPMTWNMNQSADADKVLHEFLGP